MERVSDAIAVDVDVENPDATANVPLSKRLFVCEKPRAALDYHGYYAGNETRSNRIKQRHGSIDLQENGIL